MLSSLTRWAIILSIFLVALVSGLLLAVWVQPGDGYVTAFVVVPILLAILCVMYWEYWQSEYADNWRIPRKK